MSYPTEPCFVHECNGWDEALLKHPAFKFMRNFESSFAKGTMYSATEPFGTWHTADFTYTDEVGKTTTGVEAFEKAREMYKTLLVEFYHNPRFAMVKETSDGYDCFGQADLYGNYKVSGDKNVTDPEGRSAGVWRMMYRKDANHPDGLRMSLMKIYVNALPLVAGAVNREMLSQDIMFLNAY
ncbi:hypothetical protein Dda_6951 [Drechslerella dactyloides]|uniref:Uncharacterized protein n=1 Tax=Drechslerella dactyloides TaxID=74499 RepID=A0AAD6NH39_DREDA|nr:hypothetical protein Dda_6951 [Drechslerella dactyloides]